jgi:hypothetical protein
MPGASILAGLEPATFRLAGGRSIHLSYKPTTEALIVADLGSTGQTPQQMVLCPEEYYRVLGRKSSILVRLSRSAGLRQAALAERTTR